jgi:hypothetical protein
VSGDLGLRKRIVGVTLKNRKRNISIILGGSAVIKFSY